jgi:hypothetical protein
MLKKILAGGVALSLLSSQALATGVTPNSPVTPQNPGGKAIQFTNSSTPGTYTVLYTAGQSNSNNQGSKCLQILASSNDASATHLLTMSLYDGTTDHVIEALTIPATASSTTLPGMSAGVPPFALLSTSYITLPVDSDGNPFIYIPNGYSLRFTFATTITSADVINVSTTGCADF